MVLRLDDTDFVLENTALVTGETVMPVRRRRRTVGERKTFMTLPATAAHESIHHG
jgi:hypothetical protein